VKNLISSQRFRDISRNCVIFCDTKFREIKKLFREIRNKYLAKFRKKNFVDHPRIVSRELELCVFLCHSIYILLLPLAEHDCLLLKFRVLFDFPVSAYPRTKGINKIKLLFTTVYGATQIKKRVNHLC
jgi:hypothetical protein